MTMERQPVDNVSLIYSVAMLVFEKVGFLPPPQKKKKKHDDSRNFVGEARFFFIHNRCQKKRVFQMLRAGTQHLLSSFAVEVTRAGFGVGWETNGQTQLLPQRYGRIDPSTWSSLLDGWG